MSAPRLEVIRPGVLPYVEGLALQAELEGRRKSGEIGDVVVVLEHPPVITLGHRGDATNVVASPERLAQLGITLHRTTRGGDVTYHGPGQMVLYPIVSLHDVKMGQAAFVALLEDAMIQACSDQGVVAHRVAKKRGVFVGDDKIGAVGIRVSRGVTTHGLALNIDPELAHYDVIVPCGLRDHGVTSLRRVTGRSIDAAEVEESLLAKLRQRLEGPRA